MNKLSYHRFSLLLILTLVAGMLAGCGSSAPEPAEPVSRPPAETAPPDAAEPAEEAAPPDAAEPAETGATPADPAPVAQPAVEAEAAPADTWLVMLYINADDDVLEKDLFIDLNEAEVIGSGEKVTVVAQIDRYVGAYDGGGDWTTTKRFRVLQDPSGDLETLASEEIADLGEMDMGDPATLVDFATWAIESYPAAKHALILSDHGMGWPGGWGDNDPNEGSELAMHKIDAALGEIVTQTGIGQFEVVGFDACLMGQLEVFSSIAPYARYAIGSEETEPALGWAYASFLDMLTTYPEMAGDELVTTIVGSYIDEDTRIVDDESRRRLLEEDFGVRADMSAEQLATDLGATITLTAVDLSAMPGLNAAVNDFVLALSGVDQGLVAQVRSYTQSYTSIFGKGSEPSYIDLGHFISLMEAESGDPAVTQAAANVYAALDTAILAEKHGENRPGSTGMSVYFPNTDLYVQTILDDSWVYYLDVAGRFAAASLWDDMLNYHYLAQAIDPASANLDVLLPQETAIDPSAWVAATAPDQSAAVQAPAAEPIQVSEVTLSASEIGPRDTVTLNATITGRNVSYVYYYVAYYNEEDGSYLTADMGYVSAEESKETGGVVYPQWGDAGVFDVQIDWEPTVYFLSNGDSSSDLFAYFAPEVYGVTTEQDVYTVYGLYTPAGESGPSEAMIHFGGDGAMQKVLVFTASGAPREISMKAGDTFTVWQEWLEFNPETEKWDYVYYEGDTMTYLGQPFTMAPYDAFAGSYQIGFVAEDFDGNIVESYAELTVTAP